MKSPVSINRNDNFTKLERSLPVDSNEISKLLDEVMEEEALMASRDYRPKWMINPESQFKMTWDIIMLFLVYYVSIITPFNVAFMAPEPCENQKYQQYQEELSLSCQEDSDPNEIIIDDEIDIKYIIFLSCQSQLMARINLCIDIMFYIDIVLTFITGYRSRRSINITYDIKKVCMKYLKTWFVVDFIAIFPFDKLSTLFLNGNHIETDMIKLIKLLRLTRLLKRIDHFMAAKTFRIVYLMIMYTTIAHWIGCAFFYFGRWQVENLMGGANLYTGYPWLIEQCLNYADLRTQYCVSLYWSFTTMTTVGYGDVLPNTNVDKNIACCVMLLGGIVQAIIYGNFAIVIDKFDADKKRLKNKLDKMKHFIKFYKLPDNLKYKIIDTIEYQWNINKGINNDEVLKNFPDNIKKELLMDMKKEIIPVFEEFGKSFIRAIISHFRLDIFTPEDYIIQYGNIGNEMYIIKDGICQVLSADEKIELGELKKGDYFGDINVILGGRRMANVKALTYCAIYSIKRHVLGDILSKFPDEREKLIQRTKQRKLDLIKKNYLSISNTTINPLHLHQSDIDININTEDDVKNTEINNDDLMKISEIIKKLVKIEQKIMKNDYKSKQNMNFPFFNQND